MQAGSTDSPAIVAQACADVPEFLALLRQFQITKNPGWIFRGQGNEDWELVPSVMRVDTEERVRWQRELEKLAIDPKTFTCPQAERWLVWQFRHLADQVGLPIPEDAVRLRSWRHLGTTGVAYGERDEPRWPHAELLALVALAQHHGVPTRLLDWTWKARVAAYFAARDVMRYPHPGRLAVWLLSPRLPDETLWDNDRTTEPEFEVVQVPRAANSNLAAQAGVFTLLRRVTTGVGLDQRLAQRVAERNYSAPLTLGHFMHKITLPTARARELMAYLTHEDVSAATIFPGYGGVSEALREAAWCQTGAYECGACGTLLSGRGG